MSIQTMMREYPEVRTHLAHLRALHYQRMADTGAADAVTLPKLKKDDAQKYGRVAVKVALSPEVLAAFKAAGDDWQEQINTVLLALIGKSSS